MLWEGITQHATSACRQKVWAKQRKGTVTRYFESHKAQDIGNDSSTIVSSVFNYCWWKGHFVGLTSESRISESDFLVLGCLTKSACNPLENFAILAFAFAAELKMVGSKEKATLIRGIHIEFGLKKKNGSLCL